MRRISPSNNVHQAVMVIFALFVNVANYCFQILSGRILSVEDYGLINALFSLFLIFSAPHYAIKMIVSKETSVWTVDKKNSVFSTFLTQLVCYVSAGSVIIIGVMAAIHMLDPSILGVKEIHYVILVALLSVLSYYMFIPVGIAQGMQLFFIMTFISLVLAVVKVGSVFLSAYVLAPFISPVLSILYLTIAGTLLSTLVGYILLRHKNTDIRLLPLRALKGCKNVVSAQDSAHSLIANCTLIFLMNADVFFVNRITDEYSTGLYTASMLWGKILIYALMAVIHIFYPKVFQYQIQNKKTEGLYFKTLLLCLFSTVILYVFIRIAAEPILLLLFGQRYLGSMKYINYSYAIAAMVALNYLNMNYFIAINKGRMLCLVLIGTTMLFIIAGFYIGDSIIIKLTTFTLILCVAFFVLFLYTCSIFLQRRRQM